MGSLALAFALGTGSGTASAGPLDQEHPGAVRIAVVGATREASAEWSADPLVGAVTRWDPHLVLLTGGYVTRGSAAEWRDLTDRWTALGERTAALPDRASRKGDRQLDRWREARVGGGVQDLPGSTWSAGTLVSQGVRWRVVLLDTERDSLGPGWLDQRSWLPKVLGGDDYDQLIVVGSRSLASLQSQAPGGGRAVQDLLAVVAEHAPAGRLLAVLGGGTETNEVMLHSGSFGEVHVVAGNGAVAAADLNRRGVSPLESVGEMALVDGFDAALQREWARREGAEGPERYTADRLPLRGWWQLEIEGREVALAFHLEDSGDFSEVYRIHYTRTMGWVAGVGP